MPNKQEKKAVLARWEQKAIGRIPRFENTTYEKITNYVYENARSAAKAGTKFATDQVGSLGDQVRPFRQKFSGNIMGKHFATEDNLVVKGLKGSGKALLRGAMGISNWGAGKLLSREYFFPTGQQVADNALNGSIGFDRKMCVQMYNTCGYMPEIEHMLHTMHTEASKADDSFTDIQWRQEIMPHIIRATYRQELVKAFNAIRNAHEQNPLGFNRELMIANMHAAARQLGEIFHKFSLDMANNTDYLEAPMTFIPEKFSQPEAEMTSAEAKLLRKVNRRSLNKSYGTLDDTIRAEAAKSPRFSAAQTLHNFLEGLTKPIPGPDDSQIPYAPGTNPEEDNRRLLNGVLAIRELKRAQQKRNVFSRRFRAEGRAESEAIKTIRSTLSRTLHIDLASIDRMTDLKMPLEENLSFSEVLRIAPIKYEPEISPLEQAQQIAVETVQKAGKVVNEVSQAVVSGATQATHAVVNTVSTAANAVTDSASRALMGDDFMRDVNLFDDDDMDIIGGVAPSISGSSEPRQDQPPIRQEAPEEEAGEEKEEDVKEDKKEDVKDAPQQSAEESGGILQSLWNGTKYVGSFFNPLSYFSWGETDPTAQMVTHLQNLQKQDASATYNNMDTPMTFYSCVARLIYFKTLEVSLKDRTITPEEQEQMRSSLTDEAIHAGAEKIRKNPVFMKLPLIAKGGVKAYLGFLKDVSADPAAANDLFREYLTRANALAAKNDHGSNPGGKAQALNNEGNNQPEKNIDPIVK